MITESAVRLRLDPSNWPEDLDRKELSAPFEMNRAIDEAHTVFHEFLQVHATNAASNKLTPIGKRAADAEWAEGQLPKLRQRLVKIRETAAKVEDKLVGELTAELTEPVTDPTDVALMQEIRTWLRSLPEQERLNRARTLAGNGDRSALRAILTAPTYLSGVNAELLALIRDEEARRQHPDRYAKLEAFRKAADVAQRAVEGVVHYIEQETITAPVRSSAA